VARPHLGRNAPITYSPDGRMVGVFYLYHFKTARIFICDVASGAFIHSHSLNVGIVLSNRIWAHGERLRFATADTKAITVWEVGFASAAPPTEVETLPTPGGTDPFPTRDGLMTADTGGFDSSPPNADLPSLLMKKLWYGTLGVPVKQPGRIFTSGRSLPLAIYFMEHSHPAVRIPICSSLETGNLLLRLVVA